MSDTHLTSALDNHKRDFAEMISRSELFFEEMQKRRTVRDFSPEPVPRQVIENCLLRTGSSFIVGTQYSW